MYLIVECNFHEIIQRDENNFVFVLADYSIFLHIAQK